MIEELKDYVGTLRVWSTEGGEFSIAATAKEAGDHYEGAMGHRLGQDGEPMVAPDDVEEDWTEEPAGRVLAYTNPDDTITRHTCATWATIKPAGYLGYWPA